MTLPKSPVTMMIPVASVLDAPIRRALDDDNLRTIELSYQKAGWLSPVSVNRTPEGFVVLDGHHRIFLARKWGLKEIEAKLYEGVFTALDMLVFMYNANDVRKGTNQQEFGFLLKSVMDQEQCTISQLGDKFPGRSVSQLQKTLQVVTKASPEMLKALGEKNLGASVAAEITRLKDMAEQAKLVTFAIGPPAWSRAQVVDYVRSVTKPKGAKSKRVTLKTKEGSLLQFRSTNVIALIDELNAAIKAIQKLAGDNLPLSVLPHVFANIKGGK